MNTDLPAGRQVGMIEGMNTDLSASQILIVTGKEGRKLLHFVRNDDY
ncbi:MAG: hypothetical protein KBF82_03960 [Chitinophagaceae bacterium]|nr:hypothetical protein [Chitinophagaceae bacterium]MBP9102997.1 hypothetical protein [Chitinophagaceae bacterium]